VSRTKYKFGLGTLSQAGESAPKRNDNANEIWKIVLELVVLIVALCDAHPFVSEAKATRHACWVSRSAGQQRLTVP